MTTTSLPLVTARELTAGTCGAAYLAGSTRGTEIEKHEPLPNVDLRLIG